MVSCTSRRSPSSGYCARDRVVLAAEHAHFVQCRQVDQLRADAIIDIMVVVGDLVGEIGDLRLEPRLLALEEALAQLAQLARIAHRAVLEDSLAALEGEIEAAELRVVLLELIHHAQRLQVVLEAAVRRACTH